MNINKYIASFGNVSRREADRLIKAGQVMINDKLATPIDKVQTADRVSVEGKVLKEDAAKVYFAFYKPVGVISTTDKNSPNNILAYFHQPIRVFPIGRLDVASEGLIFLTNDGAATNYILKAKKIEKEYLVKVDRALNPHFLKRLEQGVFLDSHKTLPAKVSRESDQSFRVAIVEGRKRQIRRICEKFGYEVKALKRTRIGKFELENLELKEGELKEISQKEFFEKIGLPTDLEKSFVGGPTSEN